MDSDSEAVSSKIKDGVRLKREGARQVMKHLEGESLQERIRYWMQATKDRKDANTNSKKIGSIRRNPEDEK